MTGQRQCELGQGEEGRRPSAGKGEESRKRREMAVPPGGSGFRWD